MITSVLVANRSECACRVLQSCRRLQIEGIAVHSDADAGALHTQLADRVVAIGGLHSRDSYLRVDAIVEAARSSGAAAVHPGYGFLSESAALATAVRDAGLVFVGPSAAQLAQFGDKLAARALAVSLGVPVLPASPGAIDPSSPPAAWEVEAAKVGFPLLVKAAGGGGGIGMVRVENASELVPALTKAADRARAAFANGAVYLERALGRARHVEVQVLRDTHGNCVVLGERDCSLQRRHQKLVEESPTPLLAFQGAAAGPRQALFTDARRLVEAVDYVGAATVEFLVDGADGESPHYFLEVNPRLQVEHGVTELCTGVDIVEEQFRIASGLPLSDTCRAARPQGAAIEVRLYAEDPAKGFLPQPGELRVLLWPKGLRIETGYREGDRVTPYYDPLLGKLLAHGANREEARRRMLLGLEQLQLELWGPKSLRETNRAYLHALLSSEAFQTGAFDTQTAEILAQSPGRA